MEGMAVREAAVAKDRRADMMGGKRTLLLAATGEMYPAL